MKDKVRDLLKRRFPLCDDKYFEKVSGEIEALYNNRDAVDWAGIDPCKWEGVSSGYFARYEKPPPRHREDDQGIVDTVIVT